VVAKVDKCSVNTCKYYKQNECFAPAIEINFDNTNVSGSKSEETMCKTFQPNGQQR